MVVNRPDIYGESCAVLEVLYGSGAQFREGQYEAIEATMTRKRTLVVERTGWGKSLVYFVATKLLRSRGRGAAVVVSPLLVLMQNQIEAAEKLGLRCDVLNSTVKDRRADILRALVGDELDLVLVTPETLFQTDIQEALKDIRIGLFAIDEAHCISDWGHDFRLEYGRLRQVIQQLPPSVPLLATTATANDRVVDDLKAQLGEDVYVSRGPLSRESLSIQILPMPDKAERYAWILENLENLPGSGIIYCLTQRDCDYLADFLRKNGVEAMAYHSGMVEEKNRLAEELFRSNRIKAIVSTIKLGMGYDKGDIAFVVHFQMPPNIVSYYQQIGRAGRNIERAYVFLMQGNEDVEILNYFIDTAFPTEEETGAIMHLALDRDGASLWDMESQLNIRRNRIEKALGFLVNDGFLRKEGSAYYATPKPYLYDRERYRAVSDIRRSEMKKMQDVVRTSECLSKYIVSCLDDPDARACGQCANCLGRDILPLTTSERSREAAVQYLGGLIFPIEPRKRWPASSETKGGVIRNVNQVGVCLSKYGDPGFGELVKRGKHSAERRFCEELVGKSAKVLEPLIREKGITHVTCVPSLRSDIVEDFAKRLARNLGMPFLPLLQKRAARPQKEMENSAHQCANAYRSFFVVEHDIMPERILLVDDVVDSKWTLTVCGHRLMECGCQEVYPFALAESSQKEV